MDSLHVIINTTAGNHRAAKTGSRILKRLDEKDVHYEVFYTEFPGHAEELARRSAEKQIDTVIAVGGDGTAFEAARGLMGSSTKLGIIPAGTGNDFIKSLHLPASPMQVLDFILDHPARPVDIGTINRKPFINVCGIGFDVSVLDYSINAKKYVRGMLPYLWGVIQTIIHYHSSNITLEVDGERLISGPILVCSVANGRFIGGGMPISPDSQVDDGYLDVVVVANVPRLRMIQYLPGLLGGKILTFKDTTSYKGRHIEIKSTDAMRLNVDGEIFSYDNAVFEIQPGALHVYW